ncbi:GIY-YIG nuclease family protein [Anaplasmataceae bacterium AB001_6]|nr:GIY-YIG nuclease family protein [Anaplasmataceae bacterium AB001_6]
MSIVYILTNECMPNTIKIGSTNNLERRIKELDNTSVALPFQCYYAVKVSDASVIEKKIHQGLDECRVRQNREFFNSTPEQAKSILEIAELMGGKNVTPTYDIVATPQDQEALDKIRKSRRRFNFGIIGLDEGTVLEFKKDKMITCTVANGTRVNFRDKLMSLSRSADIVLKEMGYDWVAVQGSAFWCYNGKPVYNLLLETEYND